MQKLGANLTTLGIAITLLVIICCCSYFAFSTLFSNEINTPEEYAQEYDGSVVAYREILESNDCTFIQAKFDTAYTANQNAEPGTIYYKRSLGFMRASDARMKEIGCYQ